MTGRSGGFTLVELLLAMAISAGVAITAMASMTMFTDADTRATLRMDETAGVQRALRGIRTDVANATQVSISGQTMYLTMRDSTAVAYTVVVGGTELQRLTGSTLPILTVLVNTLLANTLPKPEFSERGHLRDSHYRSAAVLQGVRAIRMTAITRSATTLGVAVEIDCDAGGRTDTARCLAMSMQLMESHAKP
jgi:prepilin-type N-terminal cleavage/methylation domain-containing protein